MEEHVLSANLKSPGWQVMQFVDVVWHVRQERSHDSHCLSESRMNEFDGQMHWPGVGEIGL